MRTRTHFHLQVHKVHENDEPLFDFRDRAFGTIVFILLLVVHLAGTETLSDEPSTAWRDITRNYYIHEDIHKKRFNFEQALLERFNA